MAYHKHSKTLFMENGEPLCFSMVPCLERAEIRCIIEHGGGKLVRPSTSEDAIKLVPSSATYTEYPASTLYSKYVRDCASRNELLPRDEYYIKPDKGPTLQSEGGKCGSLRVVRQRLEYTIDEERAIAKYVEENKEAMSIRGNKLYKTMEKENIVPRHTWQSLKEHYIKKILPRIKLLLPSEEPANWISKRKPVRRQDSSGESDVMEEAEERQTRARTSQRRHDRLSVKAKRGSLVPQKCSRKHLLDVSGSNVSALFNDDGTEPTEDEHMKDASEEEGQTTVDLSSDGQEHELKLHLGIPVCEADSSSAENLNNDPEEDRMSSSTVSLSSLSCENGEAIEDCEASEKQCEIPPVSPVPIELQDSDTFSSLKDNGNEAIRGKQAEKTCKEVSLQTAGGLDFSDLVHGLELNLGTPEEEVPCTSAGHLDKDMAPEKSDGHFGALLRGEGSERHCETIHVSPTPIDVRLS